MLAGGGASARAWAKQFSRAAGELGEQFQVFVIAVHGARPRPIDEDGVFLLGAVRQLRTLLDRGPRAEVLCHVPYAGVVFARSLGCFSTGEPIARPVAITLSHV